MTKLWLLEDLEPFPDRPRVGDVFVPTTFWVDATSASFYDRVPPDMDCSHVSAAIRRSDTDRDTEWIAELDDGFTTMLRGDHTPGKTTLQGCLFWDRYLWLDYCTEPTGQVRLIGRASHIIQRAHPSPSTSPGWSEISHSVRSRLYL